jgi:hypothetical protein
MRILKPAALYFALVFGAGFLFGTIRVLWVVPRVGERSAELMETPVMFLVIVLAARWTCQRLAVPSLPSIRFGMGVVALALLLAPEFTVVLWLRGLTIDGYVAGRDPVAGTVYVLMLGVYTMMPVLVARR